MYFNEIWTEKYRPKRFEDIVGQENIIERLSSFVKSRSMPHCLFTGPAGTGKTSTALVMARAFFGGGWQSNFLELNASDERGIDTVRTKVKDFARTMPVGNQFKIIYLDEADALTKDAQHALRRTMEKYSSACRFILGCNYISKIILPIQSRTAVFKFRPLDEQPLTSFLMRISAAEGLKVDEEAFAALYGISEGDLRKAVNILQTAAATGKKISAEIVYSVASNPNPHDVKKMLEMAMGKSFEESRKMLLMLLREQGLSGEDIIKEIHNQIFLLPPEDEKKARMISLTGECEFRLAEGCNPQVQLEALLAQIMVC